MPIRALDAKAYENVYAFETALRKVVRWELRGHFGKKWLSAMGSYGTTIIDRIAKEKKFGAYNSDHSELAYLDLNELVDLIFRDLWQPIFLPVFKKKGLYESARRNLVVVRNKVAHFRSIDDSDMALLEAASDIHQAITRCYGELGADAYLSGEDLSGEGQVDAEEISLLKGQLDKAKAPGVWDEYGRLEGVRANGLSPGIGVVGHHLFVELFTPDAYSPGPLLEFARKHRHDVTFLNFGANAEHVRFFAPLALGEKDLQQLMRSFAGAAGSCKTVENPADDYLDSAEFDLGYWEHVCGGGRNISFSFIF